MGDGSAERTGDVHEIPGLAVRSLFDEIEIVGDTVDREVESVAVIGTDSDRVHEDDA